MSEPAVTRIGDGVYRVEIDGRAEIVYLAGPTRDRWAFCNGQVFRAADVGSGSRGMDGAAPRQRRQHDALVGSGLSRIGASSALSAPMPATVIKVDVMPGARVKKGDTLIILEAMKMELPLRAAEDATVKAVHCREGEFVQPGAVLVELE